MIFTARVYLERLLDTLINATFSNPVFLDLVTHGILWSAGKLEE
jgi:hypothetical protein